MLKQGIRVLVTGGAGFIGSHLCRALVALGCQVRVVDDLSTGKRERLADLMGTAGRIELIQADVRALPAVQRAAVGAQVIVHLAGAPAGAEPTRVEEVNLRGALNVLDVAQRAGRRQRPHVILCGSGAIYGRQTAFVLHEELAPRPTTADAVVALAVEQYGRVYHDTHGVPVTNLRIFRTFGPEEDPDRSSAGVVARFIRAALDGTSPVIFGDGQQTRDLVYVDNVVTAITAALEHDGNAEPLNVASGDAIAINLLWTITLEVCGKRRLAIDPTYVPAPAWSVQHVRPQISRTCRLLGWSPSVRLREGLLRTVNHHQRLRSADPNSWFAPPETAARGATARRQAPTVEWPLPEKPMEEPMELSDEDLLEDPTTRELDIEWAPVPALPGLVRS